MRAAVTTGPEAMRVADVARAGRAGPGELLVRPEAVGLCGSDFHYFHGHSAARRFRACRATSSRPSSRRRRGMPAGFRTRAARRRLAVDGVR